MAAKKTWQQKLQDSKDLPRVFRISAKHSKRWGTGTCVIPAPIEVDELMRAVPKGKLTTINELRKKLAKTHGATIACPITTGIFSWIAAHAADEAERAGKKRITPYWRTLKANGELNPKYPGGIENLAARLRAEGHEIQQKGKRYLVMNLSSVR
jgi:alkylated DNA nucleotide flippase Atl1